MLAREPAGDTRIAERVQATVGGRTLAIWLRTSQLNRQSSRRARPLAAIRFAQVLWFTRQPPRKARAATAMLRPPRCPRRRARYARGSRGSSGPWSDALASRRRPA